MHSPSRQCSMVRRPIRLGMSGSFGLGAGSYLRPLFFLPAVLRPVGFGIRGVMAAEGRIIMCPTFIIPDDFIRSIMAGAEIGGVSLLGVLFAIGVSFHRSAGTPLFR